MMRRLFTDRVTIHTWALLVLLAVALRDVVSLFT